MYTWEIEELLKLKKYILNSEEYLHMIHTSTQIKQVKYNAYNDVFETWTKEDNNKERYFRYKVRKK